MLLYRASRPFRARMRTESTYDVPNPNPGARVPQRQTSELLTLTELRLAAAGFEDVARCYQPRRCADIVDAVQRLSKGRR